MYQNWLDHVLQTLAQTGGTLIFFRVKKRGGYHPPPVGVGVSSGVKPVSKVRFP